MVQHRFTSMKQTFMVNHRKERESKERCSGKSPDEMYKPKWILYERLKFLIKACAQAVSQSNLESPLHSSCRESSESCEANIPIETMEYIESDVEDLREHYLYDMQVKSFLNFLIQ